MSKLKPCPKCKSKDVIVQNFEDVRVICLNCNFYKYSCPSVEKAIDTWNALPRDDKTHGEYGIYGEPWHVEYKRDAPSGEILEAYLVDAEKQDPMDYVACIERSAECVNALRGIKDVQTFMDAVREAAEVLKSDDVDTAMAALQTITSMMEGE